MNTFYGRDSVPVISLTESYYSFTKIIAQE